MYRLNDLNRLDEGFEVNVDNNGKELTVELFDFINNRNYKKTFKLIHSITQEQTNDLIDDAIDIYKRKCKKNYTSTI